MATNPIHGDVGKRGSGERFGRTVNKADSLTFHSLGIPFILGWGAELFSARVDMHLRTFQTMLFRELLLR